MVRTGLPDIEPDSPSAWRRWLVEHHDSTPGVWLIWRKKRTGHQPISLDEAVREALCFGWIDSTVRPVGDGKSALLFTPRRPGSTWSRLNKQRVTALAAEGRMTDAGLRVVDTAKRDGSWNALDAVEDLRVPDDLAQALTAYPTAQANFSAFAPSTRKLTLWWIESAKRPHTRARRIAETVQLAADNRTVADRSRSPSRSSHPQGRRQRGEA
ncbi:MAG TPA: YdeI/OmpD-associated family protein [Pilimelia sp.]|nr:YdeI/OmpD-associated family protein [Pilimelia sp.]